MGRQGIEKAVDDYRIDNPNYLMSRVLPNQLFHFYLIAYGLFRFVHEFWRDTPAIAGRFSGYQVAALLLVGLGGVGFWRRAQSSVKSATEF